MIVIEKQDWYKQLLKIESGQYHKECEVCKGAYTCFTNTFCSNIPF